MGSFFATCSLSNTTIVNGQKTTIQLLVPSKYNRVDISGEMEMIIQDSGSQYEWSVFGFPIHGYYNDYGQIKTDSENDNIKMIEDYFGSDINTIVELINNREDFVDVPNIKHVDLLEKMKITFFRTEVYEYMISGWEKIDEKSEYNWWGNIFPLFWEQRTLYKKHIKDFEDLDKTTMMIHLKVLELKNKETNVEELKEYEHLLSVFNQPMIDYCAKYQEYDFLKLLDFDLEKHIDDIKKQWTFLRKTTDLYITLRPSWYGSQDNNYESQYKFHKFLTKQNRRDILDYVVHDEDDSDTVKKLKLDELQEDRIDKINNLIDNE